MLVKILAMGLSPPIWKNVFHHLRVALPKHPFSAGIFSAPEEIAFLLRDFHPERLRREGVDYIMCEVPPGAEWDHRLPFLRRLGAKASSPPVELVLTLSTLEHGIKQLIQSRGPVSLLVDRKLGFMVSDPEFIIRKFPANFPRVRVDPHISTLRLKSKRNGSREIRPESLPHGSLVGFAEIEAIVVEEEALSPQDWLRKVLKAEQARLPRSGSPGLIREPKGLFLCPGLPLDRITGAVIDGAVFSHMVDLGHLTDNSRPFDALRNAIRKTGNRHKRRWREVTRQIRIAESKADMPLVCGGGLPLVRETLAALLAGRGFRRCIALETPTEGMFREPVLVMRVGPWSEGEMGAQVEDPIVVSLEEEFEGLMLPIDALMDWRGLSHQPAPAPEIPLTAKTFAERKEALESRGSKASDGIALAENRSLLLRQERGILVSAQDKIAELLEAREAVQVWSGRLPSSVKQVVVFSHDPEEAGAVLQALPGIAKKRWFDLSSYTEPDALQALSLEPLREYLDGGAMVITSASRERLKTLRARLSEDLDGAAKGLEACDRAREFYQGEQIKIAEAKEQLARQWVNDAIDDWLERNMDVLLGQVEVLRRRHERRWFSRALVNRVVLIPSSEENREALLKACLAIYPGFNVDHSAIVLPPPPLQPEAPEAVEFYSGMDSDSATEGEIPPAREMPPEQDNAMAADDNGGDGAPLETWLREVVVFLKDTKADLLLIEHEREVAFPILERLRSELTLLAETPAIVILPDYWSPKENQPLHWPRTRIICLPRLGGLNPEDCASQLERIYSS